MLEYLLVIDVMHEMQDIQIALDGVEVVVEVVCDASRELPDRFEPLCVSQLLLELRLFVVEPVLFSDIPAEDDQDLDIFNFNDVERYVELNFPA